MPIPPKPTKSTCSLCGWSVVTNHRSDAIFQPSTCQRCGSDKLVHEQAGALEGILASSVSSIKQVLLGK
jgi:ribosomal protein L37E